MGTKKVLIYVCGLYSFGFAIFHMLFWKLFDWKNDIKKLTIANRAVIQIANLRLIYFFLFVGTICFVFTDELIHTRFGRFFMIGLSLFWVGRTVEQFIFLNVQSRMVHILTVVFIAGAVLFALPLI